MKISTLALLSLLFSSPSFGSGRQTTTTPAYIRVRTWQPPPKWLDKMDTAACTFGVRLKNLSAINQSVTIEYDDLKGGLSLWLYQSTGGISWTNVPASNKGWHSNAKSFSKVTRTFTMTPGQHLDDVITLRCGARKDGVNACVLDPATVATDFGQASAWGSSGVDCQKPDVICGAGINFTTVVTVKVS